ncbi:MAG: hypothetical protein JGK03_10080 [Microcoleus sp. PH2017_25_DOB_D_A]|uniref:hypothetical protein n=1 Tax=unclassified Microcoleus TaxID=2642155 RepID=UPI001DB93516|nr:MULTISPECIES: hypothetical protein [unclassified Microcoleus]MCC3447999.1 hypothetical protein [Microcoleus sp. PH2017_09_SFU_O_A]MCC3534529.1 hypothetical protein [Microcoleus sp. PH2017_25_DOB_D_A]MCC3546873.1 hypothetical protein [Microcoleus sp. PH2017_24_DOB_U_A]
MRVSVFILCSYRARTVRSPYKTSHDVVEADRPRGRSRLRRKSVECDRSLSSPLETEKT